MQIGDTLTHDGRRYVVRGFDPLGVSPRMIYLENVVTGAHSVVLFQDLNAPSKRRGWPLRIVKEPHAKELPKDP